MSEQPNPSRDNIDRTADFVRLLSEHERRLKGYILSLVPNWTDAEEIFADTNARLWEQFDQYTPSKDFGSWGCTVAHYLVLAYRRRQQREKLRFSDSFIDSVAAASAESESDRDDRFHFLAKCLELLDAKSRQLVRAFYAGQEKVDEIAKRTDRTSASVYKSVSRSRHWLHKCVEDRLREDRSQ